MLNDISVPSRLAEPDEGISVEELGLAARNHGLPLEALRYDLTPPGLHYLLIHYDIPLLDPATWRLRVGGLVETAARTGPCGYTGDASPDGTGDPRVRGQRSGSAAARPVSQPWLVEAVGTAEWTGVPLRDVLAVAGVDRTAVEVVFTGADHGIERGVEQDYQRSLRIDDALGEDVLLAYAMNGAPLPPQHGYPLRLVVPGWYGMAHVKWLPTSNWWTRPFTGFQQAVRTATTWAGRTRHPVNRIAPRALLVPPGFPDFMSRIRVVRPGLVRLEGRAWSGRSPVARVEITADGGRTWDDATLEPETGHRWAWRRFTHDWFAAPGHHVLSARAVDGRRRDPTGRAGLESGWLRQQRHPRHHGRLRSVTRAVRNREVPADPGTCRGHGGSGARTPAPRRPDNSPEH